MSVIQNDGDDLNAKRFVFYVVSADPPMKLLNSKVPKLEIGEVLVKVKIATICFSDVHTITGSRIEPTPRYI